MNDASPSVTMETLRGWLSGGFHSVLRMEILGYEPAQQELRIALPFRAEYSRMPEVGDYHGGVIAALLDEAGTFVSALASGQPAATANLRTDFLKAPKRCDLTAVAQIVRAGRTLIVADVKAVGDDGTVYAVARGSWSVLSR